ncbi:MAG: glutathione S-transferase [Proteobacteria bacterium]|nr:glutathione S-transferase [Pseudomonadota bacterium]
MIKLYGFTLSNYFNMVKMGLLEKGLEYEFVETQASQDDAYLSKSPMGKVPCIEAEGGFLSEANVILEYLDEVGSGPALMPKDPLQRARVRELMKEMELYIELPARTCFPEAFFGNKVSDEVKAKAKADLAKGVACLKRNGKFSPYVAGDTFTNADIIFQYSVGLASACAKRVLGMNLLEDFPQAKALSELINSRESAKQVAADQKK